MPDEDPADPPPHRQARRHRRHPVPPALPPYRHCRPAVTSGIPAPTGLCRLAGTDGIPLPRDQGVSSARRPVRQV
ncbi:hypothetical protein AB0M91_01800 [Micromonospora rifamycinica]|uniref:hypothetical protein n=1 Tax=Micromonospora rifamycinica TaxID=291594 RepID=UPI0034088510